MELQVFQNSQFGELKILTINNKQYFPATECAKILGYLKPENAIARHCKGSLKQGVLTNGGEQVINFIPKGDLYRLIVRSKLPSAEQFESWVFDEVLPQIRKTGGYIPISQEDDETTILAKAVKIADKTISQKDALIKQLEPKARMFDMFMDSSGTYSMNQVAKELKIGEYKLFQFLRDNKVLFYEGSDSVPYQRFVSNGCFKVVATIDPKGISHSTTRILPKGVKYIAKLLSKSERTVA